MTTPKRIQLSRKKGWRLPPNTVKIARPGKWGNPYRVAYDNWRKRWAVTDIDGVPFVYFDTSLEAAIYATDVFERDARGDPIRVAEIRAELRGKNLACFCEIGESCHGDVLLKIANED